MSACGYSTALEDVMHSNAVQNENIHFLTRTLAKHAEQLCSTEVGAVTPFTSTRNPDISVLGYTIRLVGYLRLEPYHIVHVTILLDKYARARGATQKEAHRLLATAVILSIKYCDDLNYNDSDYKPIVGMRAAELVRLQFDFLEAIDYRLYV